VEKKNRHKINISSKGNNINYPSKFFNPPKYLENIFKKGSYLFKFRV